MSKDEFFIFFQLNAEGLWMWHGGFSRCTRCKWRFPLVSGNSCCCWGKQVLWLMLVHWLIPVICQICCWLFCCNSMSCLKACSWLPSMISYWERVSCTVPTVSRIHSNQIIQSRLPKCTQMQDISRSLLHFNSCLKFSQPSSEILPWNTNRHVWNWKSL